ncbi:hypothetical protein GL218_06054 [Daldinia childiae]|uniref:uncharacterized protein n=1 Tax=Daldinia childiae TaxID=326645 RepID=UPI001446F7F5|nr:uncharacterized protein GL218_06054 [Daldinia childiae]KAF3057139.1 hypothetical protein GL218_06054 [Daldinia childiae]
MDSNTSTQNAGIQQNTWQGGNGRVLLPWMDDPEEIKNEVRLVYKQKQPHLDAVAGELASLLGLGDGLIAKQRMQNLFTHPALLDAFVEFAETYLEGKWDLPVGEWEAVHKLAHAHADDANWGSDAPPSREDWNVNHFYARFILRTLARLRNPDDAPRNLAYWLGEANPCDATWLLMHVLMYMQWDAMRDYKKHAPMKDRINHFVNVWKADMAYREPSN